MSIAARLEEVPRPAWIALMILGFFVYWPIGLAILAYLIWGRHLRCTGERWWQNAEGTARRWCSGGHMGSSGNWAFDEYRAETLRRLEEEQREFKEFLQRLRKAKDKAEFDQFMAERRRPAPPEPQAQGA